MEVGEEGDYIGNRYTVTTTRMTSVLRWAAMRAGVREALSGVISLVTWLVCRHVGRERACDLLPVGALIFWPRAQCFRLCSGSLPLPLLLPSLPSPSPSPPSPKGILLCLMFSLVPNLRAAI